MNKNKQELFWVVFGVVLVLLLIMAFSLFSSERPLGEASQCIKGVGKCNGQIFTPGDDNSVGEEEQMFAKDSIYEEGCAIVPPEPDDECIPPHTVSIKGLCVKPECVNSGNGNGGGNGNGNGDEQVCSGPCNADEGFVKDGDGVCVCEDSNNQPREKSNGKGYTCLGKEKEKTSCEVWGCPNDYQLTTDGKNCIRCPEEYVMSGGECVRGEEKEEEDDNEEEVTCPEEYVEETVNIVRTGAWTLDDYGCDAFRKVINMEKEPGASCPAGTQGGYMIREDGTIVGNKLVCGHKDCFKKQKACVPV